MMSRPTFSDFKQEALEKPEVREEYLALSTTYGLRKNLIALRQKAGLTQQQLATVLHTQKSNISRLENVNSTISPKLSTIEQYAHAVGHEVKIEFVPTDHTSQMNLPIYHAPKIGKFSANNKPEHET